MKAEYVTKTFYESKLSTSVGAVRHSERGKSRGDYSLESYDFDPLDFAQSQDGGEVQKILLLKWYIVGRHDS